MTTRTRHGWTISGGLALTIAGCATPPIPVQPPPPLVMVPPPPPMMPAGGYVGMKVPAKLADGTYFTPNLHNTDSAAVWHLRNALNVAALGCDLEGGGIVESYNAWIKTQAAVIDRYYQTYLREWQAPGWIDWQRVYDDDQTRIYNFYAQPAMRKAFCAAARVEIGQVGQVADNDLPTFARAALLRLDQPFVDFYAAFAAWQAYYHPDPPPVVQTANAPIVVIPSAAATTGDPNNMVTPDAAAPPAVAVEDVPTPTSPPPQQLPESTSPNTDVPQY